MKFENVYFINGTAYAGKSTMVKLLAEKYDGIVCEENYQDRLLENLDAKEFPNLTYTRDLQLSLIHILYPIPRFSAHPRTPRSL